SSRSYEYLIEKFGQEKIEERHLHLLETSGEFIKAFNLVDICKVCDPLIDEIILDYFSDIDRLKEFHGIEKVNSLKVASYLSYWTHRRRPIQIIHFPESHEFLGMIKEVNEWYAVVLLRNTFFNRKIQFLSDRENLARLNDFTAELQYYFSYRHINPQMIELVLKALVASPVEDISSEIFD
ncbi:MAG: hypothetical protein JJT78_15345, partial [Leptospira sp.]|nr:hypothetical protein [Leptospira sp.]